MEQVETQTLERKPKPAVDSSTPSDDERKKVRLNAKQLEHLRKLVLQFEQAHSDFLRLSREHPDDVVNPLKISFANQLISQANLILERPERPFADFVTFLDNFSISNSDLMLVLGQYKCCLRKFGDDDAREAGYTLCWVSGATTTGKSGGTIIPFG